MISNAKLFSVRDFDFRLQHLLIIGVLALAFSTSALLRAQPAAWGFALHEFDPWFNYRATEYIVNNGYDAYLEWNDDMSWYPYGRDISDTSQSALHLLTATLYNIFGGNSALYEFTVLLPLVVGSLTTIVIFALVRVLAGTTAGLIASLMFAISLPILLRGLIGWFKSEPLGFFFAFLGLYLLLSGIKNDKGIISFSKLVLGGIFFSIGFAAWGGIQFFLIPMAVYFIALPFFKNYHKFLLWAAPTFSISLSLGTLLFDRPGIDFVLGYGGAMIFLPILVMILVIIIQKFSKESTKTRNSFIFVATIFLIALSALLVVDIGALISGGAYDVLPEFRYFNAINPFVFDHDTITQSVQEHKQTTLHLSWVFTMTFMLFGMIGAWILLSGKEKNFKLHIPNHMKVFALIFALFAAYVAGTFMRMNLFNAIGLIILGSIGLAVLLHYFLHKSNLPIKLIFCGVMMVLFISPLVISQDTHRTWVEFAQISPTIYNGAAASLPGTNTDWLHAMAWLKTNTPTDAVVLAWWDWGYYIQTLGERTSLADNSTLYNWQIEKIARTILSPTDDAWAIMTGSVQKDIPERFVVLPDQTSYDTFTGDAFNEDGETYFAEVTGLEADYIVLYIASQRFAIENTSTGQVQDVYNLAGGGDESKKFWFAAIAGLETGLFVLSDGISPTEHFQQSTALGQLIPFTVIGYLSADEQSYALTYSPGSTPLYGKDNKFSDPDGPFILVYASPSFHETGNGIMRTVLIYEINYDYIE